MSSGRGVEQFKSAKLYAKGTTTPTTLLLIFIVVCLF